MKTDNDKNVYAIVDGALEHELLQMLERYDPPSSCLYPDPVPADLIAVAPYLISVTEEVEKWLSCRSSFWGCYLTSSADLKTLRQHLRRHLYVMLPSRTKPVFLRFYDPRNIWLFCDVLSNWQLHTFLGPIDSIAISQNGELISDNFAKRRAEFPSDAISRKPLLTMDAAQMATLDRAFETRYINRLTEKMLNWLRLACDNEQSTYSKFAKDIFYYFQRLKITDRRTIEGMAQFFLTKHYHALSEVPPAIIHQLESTERPAQINAEYLLIEAFGSVPLLQD